MILLATVLLLVAAVYASASPFSYVGAVVKKGVRDFEFWTRAGQIYSSYKLLQIEDAIFQFRDKDVNLDVSYNDEEGFDHSRGTSKGAGFDVSRSVSNPYPTSTEQISTCNVLNISKEESRRRMRKSRWDNLHELNSNRMMDLCLSMRGFYLKTGQFLGTRHDFMPPQYTSKLGLLHDQVPPRGQEEMTGVLENELSLHWKPVKNSVQDKDIDIDIDKDRDNDKDILTGKKSKSKTSSSTSTSTIVQAFSTLNLEPDRCLGSASVAQVHRGTWRDTGQACAVKIQYPNAERLMKGDLRNLRGLAEYLQRTELKFDILSAVLELQKQIANEFDFRLEGANMDFVRQALFHSVPKVCLPQSLWSSKRILVMTFVPGENLSKLAEFKYRSKRSKECSDSERERGRERENYVPTILKQRAGKKLLDILSHAWGEMIFVARVFNADPHPGNICLVGVEQEQSIENKGDTENVKNTGKATKVVKVNKGVWRNSWNIGNSGNKHRRVTRNAEVGILDWGSVKHVSDDLALRFSDMVIALNSGCRDDVIEAFTRLGVQVEKPEQERMVEAIAITMLDTRVVPG